MLLDSALLTSLFYNMLLQLNVNKLEPTDMTNVGGNNVRGNVGRSAGSCFEGGVFHFFKSFLHNIHTRLLGGWTESYWRGAPCR
jgi:hypothetical protein